MPRDVRLAITIASTCIIIATLIYVSIVHDSTHYAESGYATQQTLLADFFPFRGPSALFTPTATISLTDDNSTAFAARPAFFGPSLPSSGLSGRIWIGSGFIQDKLGHTLTKTAVEGELGCSDIPGWDGSGWDHFDRHSDDVYDPAEESLTVWHSTSNTENISGRIVLLSRGGCGFLDKVMWAQRRGATAVIVGDNVTGGPLVRMYAQGDTSNVTIPSIFTSHGTAHLLSTLTPTDFGLERRNMHARKEGPERLLRKLSEYLKTRALRRKSASTSHVMPETAIRELKTRSPRPDSLRRSRDSYYIEEASAPAQAGERSDQFDDYLDSYVLPPTTLPDVVDHTRKGRKSDDDQHHEGLWVTLTLSSTSTTPIFNTLFMLVISPLVTLAVVYTMLLLRTRIQRHRWRAPKSVVDKLPVRIYHRISENSRPSSPVSERDRVPASVSTPLLSSTQPATIPIATRIRVDSLDTPSSSMPRYGTIEATDAAEPEEEKDSGLGAWRRRHGGCQVECVICLDEYVDGESRVLELPCGHDFHAECITPWLTTRRRTCPICKGDVVRSLQEQEAGAAAQVTQATRSSDDSVDDLQNQAAQSINQDPGAALPVPHAPQRDADLERASRLSPRRIRRWWISRRLRRLERWWFSA